MTNYKSLTTDAPLCRTKSLMDKVPCFKILILVPCTIREKLLVTEIAVCLLFAAWKLLMLESS